MGWGALLKRIMMGKPRSRLRRYKYTISRRTETGWRVGPAEEIESNQRACDLARHLLERWVIDNP
jgi:hypothetical protein